MQADILCTVKSAAWEFYLRKFRNTARKACTRTLESLPQLQGQSFEISVVLGDDRFLRKLNKDFRAKDKPTNVLSFPASDKPFKKMLPLLKKSAKPYYLGDIAISGDTLKREAKEQRKLFEAHLTHLLVHGTLHLLGYDHEAGKDAESMEQFEVKILETLGVANPYL